VSGKAGRREISKVVTESRGQLVKVRIKQPRRILQAVNHTCAPRFITN